jgi:hypothetical protein
MQNLMSLKDHAKAEKELLKRQAIERANQAEWVKTHGMSERERNLIAHAEAEKKILDLQKLWVDKNGHFHGETYGGLQNLAYI